MSKERAGRLGLPTTGIPGTLADQPNNPQGQELSSRLPGKADPITDGSHLCLIEQRLETVQANDRSAWQCNLTNREPLWRKVACLLLPG